MGIAMSTVVQACIIIILVLKLQIVFLPII